MSTTKTLPPGPNDGKLNWQTIRHQIALWASALLLIVSAIAAIMAISEIAVRQELCKLIEERTNYLLASSSSEAATASKKQIADNQILSNQGKERQEGGDKKGEDKRGADKKREDEHPADGGVENLQSLRRELQTIMIVGATEERTSATITDRFLDSGKTDKTGKRHPLRYSNPLDGFNSEVLLAIALASCGLCGAVVSEFRVKRKQESDETKEGKALPNPVKERPPTQEEQDDLEEQDQWYDLKHPLLGLAVGLIILLLIKGGKTIFLIEHRTDLFAFNPHSSALLALLAGLYSKRLFRFLSGLMRLSEGKSAAQNGS